MNNPLISVIVPIYNVEKYLPKCIESIINQTYKNLEIILIDDGSPDNCGKICDEYSLKDNRIKVIHKENGGLSSARNAGLDIAKGYFIGFVDSDDYISNDFYQKHYENFTKYNCDLSICSAIPIDINNNTVNFSNFNLKNEVLDKNSCFQKIVDGESTSFICAPLKLYKKELFDNLRFPIGKVQEDEFLIHYIIDKCNKIVCIEDKLYYYLMRENSIIKSFNTFNYICYLDALYDRYKYLINYNYKLLAKKTLNMLYSNLIACILKNNTKEYKQEINYYFKIIFKLLFPKTKAIKLLIIYNRYK